MIAGALQRVLILTLAGLLVLAPAIHTVFLPAGKAEPAVTTNAPHSGGQHWSLCVDHKHSSQCTMLHFLGLAATAPVVVPPARSPEIHDIVVFAVARAEITPSARGPPYA